MREAFISTTVGLVTGAIGNGISGLKAMQTLSKVGKAMANIGVDMLQGAAGSVTNQLMRADLYGQDIDWGHFWQDVEISTAAGVASGGVACGMSGEMKNLAGKILSQPSPAVNAVLTKAIAGLTGSGTNFSTQLLNMALFDENGNFSIDLNRLDMSNINWNSVTTSGTIAIIQSFVQDAVIQRVQVQSKNSPTPLDDNGQPRVYEELSDSKAKEIATKSIKGNDDPKRAMLGKYYENEPASYDSKARKHNSQYFEMDQAEFNKLKDIYGDDGIWKINEKFLDIQIESGRKIYLSTNPEDFINTDKFYGKELRYLQDHGFSFKKDFLSGLYYATQR
ncbi:MAG: hypothetical protein LBR98_02495 [Syntrophomonadaceae bacterium]|jgi:hypothetical protein|nr:hypothetical protein [Syntrophomonadaceae bacterium]